MLTYDIIIKYLMPVVNSFSQQPNMINHDLSHFNKIFDDTFYRYGINHDNKNVSLKNSILYCVTSNQDTVIEIEDIKQAVTDLNINIIIFDFKNNIISSEYVGDFFNPWKPTIYLANYEEWWEPIINKESKIFSFCSTKSSILKNNILQQNITRYNSKEPININDNFNEIIEIEGFNNETFITHEKPQKNKLDKMKKDELIELCNKMNINISLSKPTKKDLINLILMD